MPYPKLTLEELEEKLAVKKSTLQGWKNTNEKAKTDYLYQFQQLFGGYTKSKRLKKIKEFQSEVTELEKEISARKQNSVEAKTANVVPNYVSSSKKGP